MNKELEMTENMEAAAGVAIIPEIPAPPREKSAKEIRREEKERVRRYRMEKKMEREELKNSLSVRRVGTFTMGIAMVLTGCFILYWLLHPTGNPGFLIYFAPAILIMLGGEVLYNYFFHQGDRFKYDIISSIICLLLVSGCTGLAALPVAYEYFGPERHITESRLEQEIYDVCYEKMQTRTDIAALEIIVRLEGISYDKTMTYQDIAPSDYVNIRVGMKNQFHSKEQFTSACQSVVQTVNQAELPYRYIHFETVGDGGYSLQFYQDKFSQNLSLEELAAQVNVDE